MSATGDIIMGNAPSRLPPNGGKGFFDAVTRGARRRPGDGQPGGAAHRGHRRTASAAPTSHRLPPVPGAAVVRRAPARTPASSCSTRPTTTATTSAPAGYRNTQKALEEHGLRHTGAPDQITVVEVKGVKVAVVGFSSYPWSNSLIDIDRGQAGRARRRPSRPTSSWSRCTWAPRAPTRPRVKPGTEMFLGENRGDPIKFSHAVIDAGADLVVGHGPHVLRGDGVLQGPADRVQPGQLRRRRAGR